MLDLSLFLFMSDKLIVSESKKIGGAINLNFSSEDIN